MSIGMMGMLGNAIRKGVSAIALPPDLIARWEYRDPANTIVGGRFTQVVDSVGNHSMGSTVQFLQPQVDVQTGDAFLYGSTRMTLVNPVVDDGSDQYVFYYWMVNPDQWALPTGAFPQLNMFREGRWSIAQLTQLVFRFGRYTFSSDWISARVLPPLPPTSPYVLFALETTRSTKLERLLVVDDNGNVVELGRTFRNPKPLLWDNIKYLGNNLATRFYRNSNMRIAEIALARSATTVDIAGYYTSSKGNYGL